MFISCQLRADGWMSLDMKRGAAIRVVVLANVTKELAGVQVIGREGTRSA